MIILQIKFLFITDGKKIFRSHSYRNVAFTFNSQYTTFDHNLNKYVCAQVSNYYKSSGRLDYLFTIQNYSLNRIIIYARRSDGEIIPDNTEITLNITLVEPDY